MPKDYRSQIGPAQAASFGDAPWWEVFRDPVLQDLIQQALANNLDLKQAVLRVEQARAQVVVVGSPLFPQLSYGGGAARQSGPIVTSNQIQSLTYNAYTGNAALNWELDIWGKVRRSTEAAQAELLATEDFQRGVTITLLADVSSAYFQLLSLDQQLSIARDPRSFTARRQSSSRTSTKAARRACCRSTVPTASSPTPPPTFRQSSARSSMSKTSCPSCSDGFPVPFCAARSSTRNGWRRPSRPGFPPNCWNGGPTCGRARTC